MNKPHMYSHNVMEQIKIPVTLDGDLAATILNAFRTLNDLGMLDPRGDVLFCGHVIPKLEAFLEKIDKELDIENKEEI